MKLSEIILNLRLSESMGQAALARQVKVSQSLISKMEKGEIEPDFKTFLRIMHVFGYRLKFEKIR